MGVGMGGGFSGGCVGGRSVRVLLGGCVGFWGLRGVFRGGDMCYFCKTVLSYTSHKWDRDVQQACMIALLHLFPYFLLPNSRPSLPSKILE